MSEERFQGIGCFGYLGIIQEMKHVGQGLLDVGVGTPNHLMRVPLSMRIFFEGLFFKIILKPVAPVLKIPHPLQTIVMRFYGANHTDDFS